MQFIIYTSIERIIYTSIPSRKIRPFSVHGRPWTDIFDVFGCRFVEGFLRPWTLLRGKNVIYPSMDLQMTSFPGQGRPWTLKSGRPRTSNNSVHGRINDVVFWPKTSMDVKNLRQNDVRWLRIWRPWTDKGQVFLLGRTVLAHFSLAHIIWNSV